MGTIANESTVSCQLITSIATSELTRMTTFASESWATCVITSSIRPTSFVSRDWISPVRVAVKKRSGIRFSRAYSVARRSRITPCPTRIARYVWTTPAALVTTATATMTPESTTSSCRST